jgi:hypothetical protein
VPLTASPAKTPLHPQLFYPKTLSFTKKSMEVNITRQIIFTSAGLQKSVETSDPQPNPHGTCKPRHELGLLHLPAADQTLSPITPES